MALVEVRWFLVDPWCRARGDVNRERGKLLNSIALDLRKQPEEAGHRCKKPKMEIGSAVVPRCRGLRHFGMDVQNGYVIFMKPNQVGKSAHDGFKSGESCAIALSDPEGSQRDLTRF